MACRNLAKEHVAATERLAEARRQGGTPTAEARALRALKKVWFEQVSENQHRRSCFRPLLSTDAFENRRPDVTRLCATVVLPQNGMC